MKKWWLMLALPACAQGAAPSPKDVPALDLESRVAQFAPAALTADLGKLEPSEQQALKAIIEAARLLDPIFDRQAYAQNPELEAQLTADTSRAGALKLAYFKIMRGPWDRQDHFRPFAVDFPRPPGGGFYPADLQKSELEAYLKAHPEQAEGLQSLYTVVVRNGDRLEAVPYRQAYRTWLEPAAAKLKEAATLTKNQSLKTFLLARAAAFLSDDYYESDKAWMDLESPVEVTIGPYETYEDELLGYKAAFEAFVTVTDPEASARLSKFKALLPKMEQNLPVPDAVKTVRGSESPIRVVDVVYTSGDANKSVQTIAFNLPNDERVRKEKGAKKVMLRNLIETKFERILRPLASQIMTEDQLPFLSAEAFFQQVLFHELSHSLGPAFTTKDGKPVEIRVALESSFSPLEEGKADVMGAYNVLYMIELGEFPAALKDQLLVSYFAGLFRSVRFGIAEAHGKGAAMQINYYLTEGAATFDPATGRFSVDRPKLAAAIRTLVNRVCLLQHQGDKAAVDAFLAQYGVMSPAMSQALGKIEGVPVDIRPSYPLAQ